MIRRAIFDTLQALNIFCCLTYKLSMKETSTLRKLSMTLALLAGYAVCATAQTTSATPVIKTTPTYQIDEPVNQQGTDAKGSPYSSVSEKELNASYPWFNYKGITNIQEAKLQWIQDNPAAYKQMQEGIGKNNPK